MRIRAVAVVVALVVSGAHVARADEAEDKRACVHSYEESQRRRQANDLPGARDELRLCSRDACPALVRSDCVAWLREVEAAMPSIIVSVRTRAGVDVPGARVLVDDQPVAPRAAGSAIDVRPGPHTIRVEPPHGAPARLDLVANAGEKNRLVALVVDAPGAEPAPPATERAPWPTAGIVLGALGLVAVGAGVVLDASGTVELHRLRTSCAPGCSPSDVAGTRAKIITGDVFLGVGVVSLGVATILVVTRGRRPAVAGALSPGAWSVAF